MRDQCLCSIVRTLGCWLTFPLSQLSGEDSLMATMVARLRASGVAIFRFDIRKSKT
jgi:hypothetical protein